MADDARILKLVEEVLNSTLTPEQACAQEPELLGLVKAYLHECRSIERQIERLFPSPTALKIDPNDARTHLILAKALQARGQQGKALAAFGEAHDLAKEYAAAAKAYADAFAAEPPLAEDVAAGQRCRAVRVAALAGCGLGADARNLAPEERTRWRQQALTSIDVFRLLREESD